MNVADLRRGAQETHPGGVGTDFQPPADLLPIQSRAEEFEQSALGAVHLAEQPVQLIARLLLSIRRNMGRGEVFQVRHAAGIPAQIAAEREARSNFGSDGVVNDAVQVRADVVDIPSAAAPPEAEVNALADVLRINFGSQTRHQTAPRDEVTHAA